MPISTRICNTPSGLCVVVAESVLFKLDSPSVLVPSSVTPPDEMLIPGGIVGPNKLLSIFFLAPIVCIVVLKSFAKAFRLIFGLIVLDTYPIVFLVGSSSSLVVTGTTLEVVFIIHVYLRGNAFCIHRSVLQLGTLSGHSRHCCRHTVIHACSLSSSMYRGKPNGGKT